jgi:hypothetical protein
MTKKKINGSYQKEKINNLYQKEKINGSYQKENINGSYQKENIKVCQGLDKDFTLKDIVAFQCLFLDYKNSNIPNELKEYLYTKERNRYKALCKICHNYRIKIIPIPRFFPRLPHKIKQATIADENGIIIINTLSSIIKKLDTELLARKILDNYFESSIIIINNYVHRLDKGQIPFISLEDQSLYKNNPYIDNIISYNSLLPKEYMTNPYI